jgi:transposase
MSKIRLKVNADLLVIKSQLRKDEKFSQGVRLHAVYQVCKGQLPEEVAKIYNTSAKSINNWVHKYNSGGVEALKSSHRPGRRCRLSSEQKADLLKVIQTTPSDYGYNSSTWTGPLVIDYIKKKYDIEYKRAQIYNIFRCLGFSYQKSKGFYPESAGRTEKVADIKKTSDRRRK